MRILGVCGSLQARSRNLALLEVAAATAPEGVEIAIFDGLGDLPHFNPDLDPPASVLRWRRALDDADAVLIACPEYAFSLPGVLKNAIDWVVGSGELERKVVATTAASHHADRGRRGLAALREPLTALSAVLVGGEPIARGPDEADRVAALVRDLVEAARTAPPRLSP
ncbi:MAG: NADPH-dependent FMN reductase [Vicinamibacterales bacterium]